MNRTAAEPFVEDYVPMLDPVIGREVTVYGWRGLTGDGEVLEVRAKNGKPDVPESILLSRDGRVIGRREVRDVALAVDAYVEHFNRGGDLHRANAFDASLAEYDAAIAIAATSRARLNRALVLLALGRWHEGFAEYELVEREGPFLRPQVRAALDAGIRPWRGEALAGKRLLIIHAHGFGDTIMALRFVPALRAVGEVIVVVPPELRRLARQVAPVAEELPKADFFVPAFHLLRWLGIAPEMVGGAPYLAVEFGLALQWRMVLGGSDRRRVGVAWSVGRPSSGDYPRGVELDRLVAALGDDVELHSVQAQGEDEARACGVIPHWFEDFADCAALMSLMDEVVTVDTAALHLAGATGHPRVTGLLGKWASWRWQARWYGNVELVRHGASNEGAADGTAALGFKGILADGGCPQHREHGRHRCNGRERRDESAPRRGLQQVFVDHLKDRFEILAHAARIAPAHGFILEFGVGDGRTVNYLAELPEMRERRVFGFDSFCGLPEPWGPYAKGHFAQERPPAVATNVELVVGLFGETLPMFLEMHEGTVALLHCDADLYASTKTALELLTTRIVPGTVIVLDEYYVEPDHEQRAFRDWLAEHGRRCRHIARTDEQLIVRIE
jgi:hypothetical protein